MVKKSINRIERELTVSSDKVKDMLLLHCAMYNIGAITKLINNNVKKQYLSDYRRWLKFNRTNIVYILKTVRVFHCIESVCYWEDVFLQ